MPQLYLPGLAHRHSLLDLALGFKACLNRTGFVSGISHFDRRRFARSFRRPA
jgi:hypothetical protein